MSSKSNNQGRAYEFACLNTLADAISQIRAVQIIQNSSFHAAKVAWETLNEQEQNLYLLSAKSIIPTIFSMEPNMAEDGEDTLLLYIQTDKRGEEADVRDIIVCRHDITWEIGLSIKHNHEAVKHSRLSRQRDFGAVWYGIKCSDSYWKEVEPIFMRLEAMQKQGLYFRDISSKENDIYIPLLQSFMNEIKRSEELDKSISSRLVAYLLSRYDFYKVVSIDKKRLTTIQSFNMYGTLNRSSKNKTPDINTHSINLPTRLIHIGLKPNSKTTILMCFDNGWQFSFRIHNAKDKVEPSLKFDIQIIGMPIEVNIKYNCPWQ